MCSACLAETVYGVVGEPYYHTYSACEFWVLSAKYSLNELTALDNSVLLIWEADKNDVLKINACGIDTAANRVAIGTSDISAKNKNNIIKCIEALGYTGDMVLIYESVQGFWNHKKGYSFLKTEAYGLLRELLNRWKMKKGEM